MEVEHHPWSFLSNITTYYNCGDYMLRSQAEAWLAEAGVQDTAKCVEEPYPPDEGEPRYYWLVSDLESVVKLFKVWKQHTPP